MTTAIVQANKLNLLGLVGAACDEIGIKAPLTIVSNLDPQVKQLLALANREGKEFFEIAHRLGGWEELRGEYKFTTSAITTLTGNLTSGSPVITNISNTAGIVANKWGVSGTGIPYASRVQSVDSATQVTMDSNATASGTAIALIFGQDAYSMPTDFAYFITQTFWDRTFRWQLLGPLSAQEWQVLKSGISPTGPRKRFRVMNNLFYLDPLPSDSTSTEVFEYYSNAWCQSLAGASQSKWTADTDYYTLDDDCFVLGIKWRFKAAKGLDYEQEKKTYDDACQRKIARNGGNRDIPLNASASGLRLLNNSNCPDTGFGA